MSEAGLVQAQCDASGVAAPTLCEQGSVGTRCVHNDDLCAPNDGAGPCGNGGAESSVFFAMPFSLEETDPLPRKARDKSKDTLKDKHRENLKQHVAFLAFFLRRELLSQSEGAARRSGRSVRMHSGDRLVEGRSHLPARQVYQQKRRGGLRFARRPSAEHGVRLR